jgi:predicted transcriptional regulator
MPKHTVTNRAAANRVRMNVYFDPALLKEIEALALRRKTSRSAIVEASVASFFSGDSAERMEAALSRRLDRLGRQLDAQEQDIAALGETLSLFIRLWMTLTPPLADSAQGSAKAKGAERFESFLQSLGRRLASGDRFLKELSRDVGTGRKDVPE